MSGDGLKLTAGVAPADSLVWYVMITGSADAGWIARGWIEQAQVLRDADGTVEDYAAGDELNVFEAERFASAEIARTWAEGILGGDVSWSGPGYAGSWRGFRDITTGVEIGDRVAINAGDGRREGVQDE